MVPMSTRAEDEQGALGNRVTSMAAPLPVYEEEPALRLSIVKEAMKDVKSSKQAVGAEMVMSLSGFAPPTILGQAARLQASQRLVNLLVTNVPGPQFPLYSQGHELHRPLPDGAARREPGAERRGDVATTGKLGFGLLADYDAMPDLGVFAEGLEKSIAELVQAAEERRAAERRTARSKRERHAGPSVATRAGARTIHDAIVSRDHGDRRPVHARRRHLGARRPAVVLRRRSRRIRRTTSTCSTTSARSNGIGATLLLALFRRDALRSL